jgi:serine/threonine-protein kinase
MAVCFALLRSERKTQISDGGVECSYDVSRWIGKFAVFNLVSQKSFPTAIGTNIGDTFLLSRRYDEAIAQYKRVLSLDPNFAYARFNLGWGYCVKGMYREAIIELKKSLELSNDPAAIGYLGLTLAKSGRRDEAMKLLNQLKRESAERYVPSFAFALIYIGHNEKEEAFVWLEKGVAERSSYASSYAIDPVLDDLRSDPRFKDMLKRLNLPE